MPIEITRELPAAIRRLEADERELIEYCESREFSREGLVALQNRRRGFKRRWCRLAPELSYLLCNSKSAFAMANSNRSRGLRLSFYTDFEFSPGWGRDRLLAAPLPLAAATGSRPPGIAFLQLQDDEAGLPVEH